jgi:hypothetical protein
MKLPDDSSHHPGPCPSRLVIVIQAARYRARLAAGLEPYLDDGSAPASSPLPVTAASGAIAPDGSAATGSGIAVMDVALPTMAARSSEVAQLADEPVMLDAAGAAVHGRRTEEGGLMHDVGSAATPAVTQDSHDDRLQPLPTAAEQQAAETLLRSASASAVAATSDCPDLPVGKAELAAAAAAAASNGVTLGQLVAHLRREGGCCLAYPAACVLLQ